MKEVIVYFYDNIVSIVYQGRVLEKKLDSISQGMVVDRNGFMESFLVILKKAKIKNKLFGDKIYVVKDAFFNYSYSFYLESIFTELGFIKVVFIKIEEFFLEQYTYIGIFKDYIVFYLEKSLVMDLYYFKDIPKMIDYFKDYYKDYVVLFGTNAFIPNIRLNSVNVYYIDHYQNYITQSLLKVKKCDL